MDPAAAVERTKDMPESHSSRGSNDTQAVDDSSVFVKERKRFDAVKQSLNTNVLEEAIAQLRLSTFRKFRQQELLATTQRILIMALIIRYSYWRWIEDMEECHRLLKMAEGAASISIRQLTNEEPAQEGAFLLEALGKIQQFRDSIDSPTLKTIIDATEKALSSGLGNPADDHVSNLLLLGEALVLQYLHRKEINDLDRALIPIRQAESLCQPGNAFKYICLLSIGHVEGIKYIDGVSDESLSLMRAHLRQAGGSEDDEAIQTCSAGLKLFTEDSSRLDEAISLFSISLSLRKAPHPNRAKSICHLASALFSRFEQKGNIRDLDECIAYYREGLTLTPAPHPHCSSSMNNLASALLTHCKLTESSQNLETGVELYRKALELLPARDLGRYSSLSNLANALKVMFDQQGNIQALDECISLHREALSLRRSPHPGRSPSLLSLGGALSTRFQHTRSSQDLEDSIAYYRESLKLLTVLRANASESLSGLGCALLLKFKHEGVFQDLEECILCHRQSLALRPPPHSLRRLSLNNLGNALATSFAYKGDSQTLDEAISCHREALELVPPPHTGRSSVLPNLAGSLRTRYDLTGDIQDLQEGITYDREALSLMAPYDLDRALSLNNLGCAFVALFHRSGDLSNLEEGIAFHREVLALRSATHLNRPTSLKNLADALQVRFQQTGDSKDLEECISHQREALVLKSDHPVDFLSNLGSSLALRFEREGKLQDLEESISTHLKALSLMPSQHPHRIISAGDLADALLKRFKRVGDFQDLEKCISFHREVAEKLPETHPNLPISLLNLAGALLHCFEHRQNMQDLLESISCYTRALGLTLEPNPIRPLLMIGLADSYLALYETKGSIQDLRKCTSIFPEAMSLMGLSHSRRSSCVNSVGCTAFRLYNLTKDSSYLDQCISYLTEALDAAPAPNPVRSSLLYNLGGAFYEQFMLHGTESDLKKSLTLIEDASKYETGPLLRRLRFARTLTRLTQEHQPSSAIHAYQYIMDLLPLLAPLDLTLKQRQNALVHIKDIPNDASRCAIVGNQLETAVTFLSVGRSIFWSQALQLRTPLDRLASIDMQLANELQRNSQMLDATSYSGGENLGDKNTFQFIPFTSKMPIEPTTPSNSPSPLSLVKKRNEILEKIRNIDGFDRFLLPPTFDSLKNAAVNGPIILLNANATGCDALILQFDAPVQHVSLQIKYEELGHLKDAIQRLARGEDIESHTIKTIENTLKRDMFSANVLKADTNEDDFQAILKVLWISVVEPVIRSLRLEKTNVPSRIWWCATGIFSFLPIHAAGIYDPTDEGSDCLSDYAIPSYCSTPEDLISLSSPSSDFKMLAVIEPDVQGGESLPGTLNELEKIKTHIPAQEQLITRIGSRSSPVLIDDVLTDLQECSFVHFGCHGFQNNQDPLESYLLLSGGKLTMSDIIRKLQTSKASLAYLSACQTATSDEERPDESLNLVAAMGYSGFRSVIGTMWSIFDADAPIVAETFYSHLFRNGTSVAPNVTDAAYGLHLAVKELRSRGVPFRNWVPFVHFGI